MSLHATSPVCDLLGLGAIGSVPFNFPGAGADALKPFRATNPRVPEASLPAGDNAQVPLVLGGDLGAPFLHSDGRLYFTFGDTFPAAPEGIDPAFCQVGQETCQSIVYNDDLLASAASDGWTSPDDCIDLAFDRSAIDPERALPITWNGGYTQGGAQLGPGIVPGPGFSTGRYIFMLMPGPTRTCSVAASDCAAVGGIEGDHCLPVDSSDAGHCYFGECAADSQSACALRLNAMTLAVRDRGSNLVTPQVGQQIASQAVLDAYRGHFSTVSFYSRVDFDTGDGAVWVVGRDSFWGATDLTMSPYLMVHPVHDGQLGDPKYYAGTNGSHPTFSRDRSQARPIYPETKALTNHTSIMYEPELNGGTWLMLYGGHEAPALSATISFFVRPVPAEDFYGRDLGIYLRSAKQPWGPWSEPITIFNPYTPGEGGYCENMYFDDPAANSGFECSFDSAAHNQSLDRSPAAGMAEDYGAAFVPGYTSRSQSDARVTIHWLLSTWNPYRVMLMKSELDTLEPGAPSD